MEKILHYRPIRQLGKGGMGEVWLVEDENIGRMMAFKMIHPSMSRDPQLVERFKQEARLQASLNHPNIVTLHTFFQHGERHIIGMEYAAGITLKELIARTGPIPYQRAVPIFRQICQALIHSHSKGVYHRDIKPANVMVDTDNADTVKVMDFGIAKAASGPGLTRTGFQIGTPAFMSPEQIRGSKTIDHRSDIYSLGVLLYHMLCGRPPFDEDSMSDFDLRNAVVNTPLPDPLIHYPSIPLWLKGLIYAMCAKEPEQRLQSMQLVLQALDAGGMGEMRPTPVKEPPPPVMPSVRKDSHPDMDDLPPRRSGVNPLVWVLPVVAVAVIVAAVLLLLPKKRTESIAAEEVPYSREESAVEDPKGKPVSVPDIRMVRVGGGSFQMGRYGRLKGETPAHTRIVSDFMIGVYEVTNREWTAVWSPVSSDFTDPNLPANGITWWDAVRYCNRLSEASGLQPCYSIDGTNVSWDRSANGYRLPTETEWEFAALGGMQGNSYKYSGSGYLDDVAWHSGNSSNQPHPPGALLPNELGLYDMSGNMWEWCWDWSASYTYGSYPTDYAGPPTGDKKVMRGGSWKNKGLEYASVSYRNVYNVPEYVSSSVGLRLARNAAP